MSIQACRIQIFGYSFGYKEPVFSYIDIEDEFDFVDKWGIPTGYYDFQCWKSLKPYYEDSCLAWISDGMNGDYKYFGYIKRVTHIEDTHGSSFWEIEPRFDDWVMKSTKRNLELLTQRRFEQEPELYTFDHYQ